MPPQGRIVSTRTVQYDGLESRAIEAPAEQTAAEVDVDAETNQEGNAEQGISEWKNKWNKN